MHERNTRNRPKSPDKLPRETLMLRKLLQHADLLVEYQFLYRQKQFAESSDGNHTLQ